MNGTWLDFEKPLLELERRIEDARGLAQDGDQAAQEEVQRLERKVDRLRQEIYSKLTRWQRVKLARHRTATVASATIPPSSAVSRSWTGCRS